MIIEPNSAESWKIMKSDLVVLIVLPFLTFAAGLSGCATNPVPCRPVVVEPVKLPPPPQEVMQPRSPTFSERLLKIFPPSH